MSVTNDPDRIPVIVGGGQVNDRPADPQAGLDSLQLMAAALRAADDDAGGGWLAGIDSLAVVDQISFRQLNPVAPKLADALGIVPGRVEQTAVASGDSPVLLLNEAANRIGAGEISIAAVVGSEAQRNGKPRQGPMPGGIGGVAAVVRIDTSLKSGAYGDDARAFTFASSTGRP